MTPETLKRKRDAADGNEGPRTSAPAARHDDSGTTSTTTGTTAASNQPRVISRGPLAVPRRVGPQPTASTITTPSAERRPFVKTVALGVPQRPDEAPVNHRAQPSYPAGLAANRIRVDALERFGESDQSTPRMQQSVSASTSGSASAATAVTPSNSSSRQKPPVNSLTKSGRNGHSSPHGARRTLQDAIRPAPSVNLAAGTVTSSQAGSIGQTTSTAAPASGSSSSAQARQPLFLPESPIETSSTSRASLNPSTSALTRDTTARSAVASERVREGSWSPPHMVPVAPLAMRDLSEQPLAARIGPSRRSSHSPVLLSRSGSGQGFRTPREHSSPDKTNPRRRSSTSMSDTEQASRASSLPLEQRLSPSSHRAATPQRHVSDRRPSDGSRGDSRSSTSQPVTQNRTDSLPAGAERSRVTVAAPVNSPVALSATLSTSAASKVASQPNNGPSLSSSSTRSTSATDKISSSVAASSAAISAAANDERPSLPASSSASRSVPSIDKSPSGGSVRSITQSAATTIRADNTTRVTQHETTNIPAVAQSSGAQPQQDVTQTGKQASQRATSAMDSQSRSAKDRPSVSAAATTTTAQIANQAIVRSAVPTTQSAAMAIASVSNTAPPARDPRLELRKAAATVVASQALPQSANTPQSTSIAPNSGVSQPSTVAPSGVPAAILGTNKNALERAPASVSKPPGAAGTTTTGATTKLIPNPSEGNAPRLELQSTASAAQTASKSVTAAPATITTGPRSLPTSVKKARTASKKTTTTVSSAGKAAGSSAAPSPSASAPVQPSARSAKVASSTNSASQGQPGSAQSTMPSGYPVPDQSRSASQAQAGPGSLHHPGHSSWQSLPYRPGQPHPHPHPQPQPSASQLSSYYASGGSEPMHPGQMYNAYSGPVSNSPHPQGAINPRGMTPQQWQSSIFGSITLQPTQSNASTIPAQVVPQNQAMVRSYPQYQGDLFLTSQSASQQFSRGPSLPNDSRFYPSTNTGPPNQSAGSNPIAAASTKTSKVPSRNGSSSKTTASAKATDSTRVPHSAKQYPIPPSQPPSAPAPAKRSLLVDTPTSAQMLMTNPRLAIAAVVAHMANAAASMQSPPVHSQMPSAPQRTPVVTATDERTDRRPIHVAKKGSVSDGGQDESMSSSDDDDEILVPRVIPRVFDSDEDMDDDDDDNDDDDDDNYDTIFDAPADDDNHVEGDGGVVEPPEKVMARLRKLQDQIDALETSRRMIDDRLAQLHKSLRTHCESLVKHIPAPVSNHAHP
ncbi:hypothetical protein PYCC9005_002798 [Savitreella phatthalungensis]